MIGLDGRAGLAGLHLQAHALVLQAHLALDAGAALRLCQPELLVPIPLHALLFGCADPIFLLALLALDLIAGAAFLLLAGAALGLQPDALIVVLAADAVVLHPPQLPQGEEGGVLLTLLLGHERSLLRLAGSQF